MTLAPDEIQHLARILAVTEAADVYHLAHNPHLQICPDCMTNHIALAGQTKDILERMRKELAK